MKTLKITYISRACFIISFNEISLMTDPCPEAENSPVLKKYANEGVAGVYSGKSGRDHCYLKGIKESSGPDIPLVLAKSPENTALTAGFNDVKELLPWERARLGRVLVTGLPPGPPDGALPAIFQAFGITVFFGSGTLFTPDFGHVKKKMPKPDLAILPIGGKKGPGKKIMGPEEAAGLCTILEPDNVIPVLFAGNEKALAEFQMAVKILSPETRVRGVIQEKTIKIKC